MTRSVSRARAVLAVLAAVLAAGVAGTVTAQPAAAHARLRSTAPAASATLASAPQEVVLTFNEPPIGLGTVVRVTGPGGTVVSTGAVRVVDDEVHQTLAPDLPDGAYQVEWRVTSDDGHPVSDRYAFTVRSGAAGSSTSTGTPSTTSASSAGPSSTSTPTTAAAPAAAPATPTADEGTGGAARWLVLAAAALAVVLALPLTRTLRRSRRKPQS